jgi:hypothetical protein
MGTTTWTPAWIFSFMTLFLSFRAHSRFSATPAPPRISTNLGKGLGLPGAVVEKALPTLTGICALIAIAWNSR